MHNLTKTNVHRKTKIIATVGPSSNSLDTLCKLLQAGVNVFRLNFSHGSHAEHLANLNAIREASKKTGIAVATLQDLSGPKIRISKVKDDRLHLADNSLITLRLSNNNETAGSDIYVELVDPETTLQPGHSILCSDGSIEFKAEKKVPGGVECRVIKGGNLRSRVGIAFPDSNLKLPATTEKDLKDLAWGIQNDIDYVAISFVQTANDVERVREFITEHSGRCNIIAKIEMRSALENIHTILDRSDGIMIARGDLGVEVPIERLPLIQKDLISKSNYLGKPVIVATQMLHSMVTSIRPTRAEVIDCANAVMSGADAVMLSEETAIGQNPVNAVSYLDKIAKEAESSFTFEEYRLRLRDSDRATVPDAIAYAACAAAIKVEASAIIACTQTGTSARLVAKYRPQQPLFATTSNQKAERQMCLYWGVRPILCDSTKTHEEELTTALTQVQNLENLPNDSMAVVTGGLSTGTPGSSSVLEVRKMNYR